MNIFDSFIDAGQDLPEDERAQYYMALVELIAYGREPNITGAAKAVFTAIRPIIDKSRSRADSGRKGGMASKTEANSDFACAKNDEKDASKTEANSDFASGKSKSKSKGNSKVIGTVDSFSSEKELSEKPPEKPPQTEKTEIPYSEIVDYLNDKAGTHFRASSEETRKHIRARWRDGYRIDDFKRVIDGRCAKWLKDPKMAEFIRPPTLFGAKFEGYLNDSARNEVKRDRFAKYADL